MTQTEPNRATRDSWNTGPPPTSMVDIPFELELTEEDFAPVRLGFIPRDMDDKWFIYEEDETLYFHRSWTGALIFKVDFAKEGEVWKANGAAGVEGAALVEGEEGQLLERLILGLLRERES